ncbi:lipid asymmetry maintenance protein MlaB [Pelagibacterium halotolerans]|uniref:STAS domain-containing protein n=1 Tax=Pelagibacterium halotolerans TaxID=531813 RepID=UPI00384A9AED
MTETNLSTANPDSAARRGPGGTVRLEDYSGIKDAARIANVLRTALQEADAIEVDLAALTEFDVSIAQLLVAARKSAVTQGKTFELNNVPGGSIRAALIGLGLLGTDGEAHGQDEAFWLGADAEVQAA